ncbi:MAG: DUF1405 domain-containing protein [Candidatus Hodarchaeales archaeon]|jgi:uncharacterized membrane protein YpjA
MKLSFRAYILRIQKLELKILGLKPFVGILIIGNFLGAFIGFLYYFNVINLAQYAPILWILIPDCPMVVLLLLGVYIQFENQQFSNYNFFVFIQGIRAAFFTFLIITNFGSIDPEIVILGHFLLLVQAIALLPLLADLKFSKGTLISISITIFNDITDFFGIPGIFDSTLAQLLTIQTLFPFFVISIFGLDFILILTGLGFAWYMGKKSNLVQE